MDFTLGFTARQCDPTSLPLDVSCSSYEAPYNSTSLHNDNGRTMPRHKSLPSIKSTMFSTGSAPKRTPVRERSDSMSTNSLRRSVSGMKNLLPLTLSSSLPTPTSNSTTPPQRSTFGFEDQPAEDTPLRRSHQSSNRRFHVPRPITIRREQYRDTPIYTEPGSPLLNLAYYTDEQVSLDSSAESCDETSNIYGYASSSCESEDLEDLDEETPLPVGFSPTRMNRRPPRNSELSFKCLGELERSLFRDEAAWLSSPLNRWNASKTEPLPQLLAENMPGEHDIEGCLSPSDTSSFCGDDLYARATSLAPARAQVVNVNTNQPSFKIPPRSSSLAGARPQSLTSDSRKSRMASRESYIDHDPFHSWIEDSVVKEHWLPQSPLRNAPDLAMTTPPLSPIRTPALMSGKTMDPEPAPDSNAYSDEFRPPRASDSISQILSDLDQLTSNFPSSTLFPDEPCVRAIRVHLKQSSQSQWELPTPPLSPFSEGVDWRPRPKSLFRRPKVSLQRTCSLRTSETVPVSKQDWNQPTQETLETPLHPQYQSHQTPVEPDLQPLAAIFPNTPHELRSALYAHILAYLFLNSLPDHYLLPQNHTPPPSPPYTLPYFTTTRQSLSSKAADRLGIFTSADRPRRINVGGDAIILRHSGMENDVGMLMDRVRASIGSLIAEMRDDENWPDRGARHGVDAAFLRALGEIVKGCERECFGVSKI